MKLLQNDKTVVALMTWRRLCESVVSFSLGSGGRQDTHSCTCPSRHLHPSTGLLGSESNPGDVAIKFFFVLLEDSCPAIRILPLQEQCW